MYKLTIFTSIKCRSTGGVSFQEFFEVAFPRNVKKSWKASATFLVGILVGEADGKEIIQVFR